MSSQKRIEANRANALKSTGPATPEGKAASSRNALKHGLLSREVVLAGEDPAEFEGFRQRMAADLRPVGELEETLAERVAAQWWRLKRIARAEGKLFEHDERRADAADPGGALAEVLGAMHNPYDTLRRYERAIERGLESVMRQFREAQELRAGRQDQEAQEQSEVQRLEAQCREMQEKWLFNQRRRERLVQELDLWREYMENAGIEPPRSTLLEYEIGGIDEDPDDADLGRLEAESQEAEASQRPQSGPGASAPDTHAASVGTSAGASGDDAELRRYGGDKGQ